jgi:serine phosphatase RsbU (regulator of sigma subunit)
MQAQRPILFYAGSSTTLEATGMPMGIFSGTEYRAGAAIVPSGGTLLLFTDGLTDSIPENDPQGRLCGAISDNPAKNYVQSELLIDPGLRRMTSRY